MTSSVSELVDIQSVVPGVEVDLKYATSDNFTGQVIYDFHRCYLLTKAAFLLKDVQAELQTQGLGLKIWDGFRPISAQWKLWELVPDKRFVADPRKGGRHTRGTSVDLTLIRNGREVPMPSGFDDMSEKASVNYIGAAPDAIANRDLLQKVMEKHGFAGVPHEWWHFDLAGWENYPVIDQLENRICRSDT